MAPRKVAATTTPAKGRATSVKGRTATERGRSARASSAKPRGRPPKVRSARGRSASAKRRASPSKGRATAAKGRATPSKGRATPVSERSQPSNSESSLSSRPAICSQCGQEIQDKNKPEMSIRGRSSTARGGIRRSSRAISAPPIPAKAKIVGKTLGVTIISNREGTSSEKESKAAPKRRGRPPKKTTVQQTTSSGRAPTAQPKGDGIALRSGKQLPSSQESQSQPPSGSVRRGRGRPPIRARA
ncbi:hypothetical protein ACQ4LE_007596 [Meloidogyne hapla]|uniref:Serine/arginine repetitive matrix protein 2-like n=1 Tax=Meloidogyne hapla TaxID=6305 RepID=A0A1I8BBI6_MELHA